MKRFMTDDEFDVLRRILEKTAGLVHDESRRDALAFAVAGRIQSTNVGVGRGLSADARWTGGLVGAAAVARRRDHSRDPLFP